MFFQYTIASPLIIFISNIFFALGNIFLIIVGGKYLEKREKINGSYYFSLLGGINLLRLISQFFLTDLVSFLSISTVEEMYLYLLYAVYTPAFFIDLITFGVLFILLSLRNEAFYGKFLLYAAVTWILKDVLAYLATFMLFSSLSIGMYPLGAFLVIIGTLNIISTIFLVAFNVILIIYSIKTEELYLKISAIVFLISTIFLIIFLLISI